MSFHHEDGSEVEVQLAKANISPRQRWRHDSCRRNSQL